MELEVRIKGGLPVLAKLVRYDLVDAGDEFDAPEIKNAVISIHWLSGKEVTRKVYESIPSSDMWEIEDQLTQLVC